MAGMTRRKFLYGATAAAGWAAGGWAAGAFAGEDGFERRDSGGMQAREGAMAPDKAGDAPLAIIGAGVFDGHARLCASGGNVLVAEGKIAALGLHVSDIPSGVRILDGRGKTILPGVIIAHMHGAYAPAARRELFLAQGVTTVCNLGAPLEAMPDMARDRDEAGRPAGSCVMAGPIITAPGGYPGPLHGEQFSYEVSGETQAAQAVEKLMARGASVIKIAFEPGQGPKPWPILSRAESAAVVRAAHEAGALVRAHVEDLSGLFPALLAGVDAVEHLPSRWRENGSRRDFFTSLGGEVFIPKECEELFRRMIGEGVFGVSTLDQVTRSFWENAEPLAVVGRFHDLGGRIALGTDYPYSGVEAGMPLREMELLRQAGLSNTEILRAGTSEAALVCGLKNGPGILAPGRPADLVMVEGDPFEDLAAMARPVLVLKNGETAVEALRA